MNNKIKNVLALAFAASTVACVTVPEPTAHASIELKRQALSTASAPDLSPYVRIELYTQSANASAPPEQLMSQFVSGKALFDVVRTDGTPVGRLHVQPEECRDDPNTGCERRFTINGRLQALGANLTCAVPVRNDTNVGYGSQTLSGLCQSQFGRAYTIQMFSR